MNYKLDRIVEKIIAQERAILLSLISSDTINTESMNQDSLEKISRDWQRHVKSLLLYVCRQQKRPPKRPWWDEMGLI
jgi:hypothetical protein